jgi:hypothetical protein
MAMEPGTRQKGGWWSEQAMDIPVRINVFLGKVFY